jgi:hypothetical protein
VILDDRRGDVQYRQQILFHIPRLGGVLFDLYRYPLWALESAPALKRVEEDWGERLLPVYAPDICRVPKETRFDKTNKHE